MEYTDISNKRKIVLTDTVQLQDKLLLPFALIFCGETSRSSGKLTKRVRRNKRLFGPCLTFYLVSQCLCLNWSQESSYWRNLGPCLSLKSLVKKVSIRVWNGLKSVWSGVFPNYTKNINKEQEQDFTGTCQKLSNSAVLEYTSIFQVFFYWVFFKKIFLAQKFLGKKQGWTCNFNFYDCYMCKVH